MRSLAAGCSLLAASCAQLPDARLHMGARDVAQVEILSKLSGNGELDILQQHVAVEQAIVGSPLTAGRLRAGVKIYERRGAMLHAKTATIDGVWSCVGSTNLDWRSFLHNDELDATILGREFASQMQAAFAADLEASEAIDLERWNKRRFEIRVKERAARLLEYWL